MFNYYLKYFNLNINVNYNRSRYSGTTPHHRKPDHPHVKPLGSRLVNRNMFAISKYTVSTKTKSDTFML